MHTPFMPFGFGGLEAALGATVFLVLLLVMTLWSLSWKALGLWQAAKNGQVKWFILMLLVNTVGIVEIIYLFFFRKDRATTPILPWLKEWKEKRQMKKASSEDAPVKKVVKKTKEPAA